MIKVPVKAPQEAKIVSSPRIFMDSRTNEIAGLTNGGTPEVVDHGIFVPSSSTACTKWFVSCRNASSKRS